MNTVFTDREAELAAEIKRDAVALVEMRNTQGWRVYREHIDTLRSEYEEEIRSMLGGVLTQEVKDRVFMHQLKLASFDTVNDRIELIIDKAVEIMRIEKEQTEQNEHPNGIEGRDGNDQ